LLFLLQAEYYAPGMKNKIVVLIMALSSGALFGSEATDNAASPASGGSAGAPMFAPLADAKWNPILPELGADSPQICILRVDPATKATQLLIKAPKAIHIRRHWHTGNETHTLIEGTATFSCEGSKAELGPGGFNFMPAKMVHEAWLSAGSLTFITTDAAWDVNWVDGPPTPADMMK
jgi:quercetin dioxygenase-like cupin family protein